MCCCDSFRIRARDGSVLTSGETINPASSTASPLVSIVTPSLNAGRFIEETIQSVLSQDYQPVEYLIVDGGSTDGTCEIASRYRSRLHFESRPDSGQAAALNRGFAMAGGQLFGYLNADDVYRPGTISAIVEASRRYPAAGVIYGEADWIDDRSGIIGRYPTAAYDFNRFQSECFICQPAAFLRRDVFEALHGLNAGLHFALDYDLWIRAGRRFPFVSIDRVLAASRMHRANKTLGQRSACFHESINVVRKHFGYVPMEMIYGLCASIISRKDLFFEATEPSRMASLLSVPMGLYFNRAHPLRFLEGIARLSAGRFLSDGARPH